MEQYCNQSVGQKYTGLKNILRYIFGTWDLIVLLFVN